MIPHHDSSEIHNISTGGGDYAERGNIDKRFGIFAETGGTIVIGSREETPIPRYVPLPPDPYQERIEIEQQLYTTLSAPNAPTLTILHGMPGTGKTSLASHVVQQLRDTGIFRTILWGDLATRSLDDQLWSFLIALGFKGDYGATLEISRLRDMFWHFVIEKHPKALIVFDNLTSTKQLYEILPRDLNVPESCRILAISIDSLEKQTFAIKYKQQSLDLFTEDEALALFQHLLKDKTTRLFGDEPATTYRKELIEIANLVGYLPELIVAAAYDITQQRILPGSYLDQLRHRQQQGRFIYATEHREFNLIFQNLADGQARLFELIGMFGEGDWHYNMLAAVSLQAPEIVREVIESLVRRNLVQRVGNNRYRVHSLARRFLQERINQKSLSDVRVSYHLLARYCLDIAQDLDALLNTRSNVQPKTENFIDRTDEAFVRAFRDGLMPEMSHIRTVLKWAIAHNEWNLLLRFAYVPYAEILKHVTVIAPTSRESFSMVTIQEPTIKRTELELDIASGYMPGGVFHQTRLVNSQWAGVRASGLVCRNVDISGCRFLACDLSYSVWVNCDARHITMLGCNLSYAVLKNVKLHGANLQGIDFTGSVLVNVDLRGADLRGANMTGVNMHAVNLNRCNIDGVRWVDAEGKVFIEKKTLDEIKRAANDQQNIAVKTLYRHKRPSQSMLDNDNERYFGEADLRAVRFTARNLTDADLRYADLRIADLIMAKLENACLDGANLQAAMLMKANFRCAKLPRTDLRAAILTYAILEKADLSYAILRLAHLVKANLREGILDYSNLCAANLSGADLYKVSLIKADLSYTIFKGASLCQAYLHQATLQGADLSHSNFEETDLTGTIFTDAILRDASITTEQLLQIDRLGGATLPNGKQVLRIENRSGQQFARDCFLEFMQADGKFQNLTFDECYMFGARFEGNFSNVSFINTDLQYARLMGTFSNVKFAGANLSHVKLQGVFVGVDFSNTNLYDIEFQDVKLINSDLTGARNVHDDQLCQLKNLRGTKMPDGQFYDNRFNLPGDREDARKMGYNPEDAEAMQQFCSTRNPQYKGL